MKHIKVYVHVTRELDNYETGCDPDTFQDLGCIEKLYFNSIDDLTRNIDVSECEVYKNRLTLSRLVDDDGYKAGAHKLELFKQGLVELWCESTTYYLSTVIETEFTEDQTAELLNQIKKAV